MGAGTGGDWDERQLRLGRRYLKVYGKELFSEILFGPKSVSLGQTVSKGPIDFDNYLEFADSALERGDAPVVLLVAPGFFGADGPDPTKRRVFFMECDQGGAPKPREVDALMNSHPFGVLGGRILQCIGKLGSITYAYSALVDSLEDSGRRSDSLGPHLRLRESVDTRSDAITVAMLDSVLPYIDPALKNFTGKMISERIGQILSGLHGPVGDQLCVSNMAKNLLLDLDMMYMVRAIEVSGVNNRLEFMQFRLKQHCIRSLLWLCQKPEERLKKVAINVVDA